MRTRDLIGEFLSAGRFAVIGVSRKREEFSRRLFDEFTAKGYDVVPVNPNTAVIEGKQCFPTVKEIVPPVAAALIVTPKDILEEVLRDCAEGGVTLVWIYGISGERSLDPRALAFCEQHGMRVVPGYCPFMFMPKAAFFHRIHGAFMRIFGRYPR